MRSAASSASGSPKGPRLNRSAGSALTAGVFWAVLLLLPAGAGAQWEILQAGTWPDAEILADHRGRAVGFDSTSPFGLSDLGGTADEAPPTRAQATLFMPEVSGEDQAVPAVILLHGAAGILFHRELTYARQFAAMGIAALVIDVFASRRDRANGFVERLLEITETMMLADAYAGLRFLGGLQSIDARRIALIGFSYGGMVSVLAAYDQVAESAAPGGRRFAAHVGFYGPCIARFEDARATGAPVLKLWGAKEALVDPARCREIADDLIKGGSKVATIAYEGAYHQWDGGWDGPFKIGRNIADCRLRMGPDGVAWDQRTYLPMTGPLLRRVILAMCVDDEGYMIGRDPAVRARSNRDVGRFLAEVFGRSPAGAGTRNTLTEGGGGG